MTESGSASTGRILAEERWNAWAGTLPGSGAKVVEQAAGQEQLLIGQEGLSEFGHSGQSSHSSLWGRRSEALATAMVASAVVAIVPAILRPLSVVKIAVAKINMARNRSIDLFPERPEPQVTIRPGSYKFTHRNPIRGKGRWD